MSRRIKRGRLMNGKAGLMGVCAAFLGAVAVALGAFAAHGIKNPVAVEWLRTGAHYLLIHAVAALAALSLAPARIGKTVAMLFNLGGLIFCGTLTLMAFGGPRWLGAVTPIGGTLLILGWLVLFWGLSRRGRR